MYILIGLLLLLLGMVAPAAADPYFNSSEPGCGTDPNVLMCDDFEKDNNGNPPGTWFFDCCGITARNKGWGASYPADPPGATRCGPGVTPFGNCAANSGPHHGPGQASNMALHHFKTAGCGTDGTQRCGVPEAYVRWYQKWDAGHQFGQEKNMNFTNSDGDIAFSNVVLNCGTGQTYSTGNPYTSFNYGSFPNFPNCGPQNQGNNISIQSGRWYFFEFHVRAGSNATIELWVNDCGVDGRSCGAAPILRTRYTGGNLPGNANGSQIETIWPETWANPASVGTGTLMDQIKVSRVGPIGLAGTSGPPPVASYTLLTTPQGAGTVTGGGSYPVNTVVTPIAAANAGATFTGWSGDCTGMTCTVTMTSQKAVTATFTGGTTPPPVTGCAITPTPAAITFAHPPGGPLPPPQSLRVVTSDGSPYKTFDTGFYDAAPCYATSCPSGTLTTITPMPTTLSLAAGTYTYPLDLTAGPNCPKVSVPVVLTIGAPPAPSMGKLTVEAQITRCNYFLTAEPPDATGGWVAQFYRDGANKVGNPIPAAPYRRSVELFAPSHSFSVDFTKTGQLLRSPAVVTRVCP